MTDRQPGKERRTAAAGRPAARDEHALLMRSLSQVDWLTLLVVVLYLLVDDTAPQRPAVAVGAMLVFAVFAASLRLQRFPLRSMQARIALDAAVMIAFISLMASQSGGPASPLVNLYLLPIVLTAVMLERGGAVIAFIAVAAAFVLMSAASGMLDRPLPAIAARLFGELGPFALVATLTQQLTGSVRSARQRLAELAEFDSLTGLYQPRSFLQLLQREHAGRAGRGHYALLMIDIDRLQQVNENWGRSAGDTAVAHVAEAIRLAVRASDVAARHGGDEFAVFLPDATPQVAEAVAQRIRNAVFKSLYHPGERAKRLTVSVGTGCYPRDGQSLDEVLATADEHMRQDQALRRQPGDPEPPRPSKL